MGNIVALSPNVADDVLISADLHGDRENFQQVLAIADMAAHPRRHLVLQEVLHGGPAYPNGACRSHSMLEAVAELILRYPGRVHYLLSNHELSELIDFPIRKNGVILLVPFRMGIQTAYGDDWELVLAAYKSFIASCPLALCLPGNTLVSHSAPEKVDSLGFDTTVFHRPLTSEDLAPDGAVGQLVWGRDYRQENVDCFAEMVRARLLIHGHTHCPDGFSVPNDKQIILDCCSPTSACLLLPARHNITMADAVRMVQTF